MAAICGESIGRSPGIADTCCSDPDELARLAAIVRARPVVFDVWAFCMGRKTLEEAAKGATGAHEHAQAIAERALAAFSA